MKILSKMSVVGWREGANGGLKAIGGITLGIEKIYPLSLNIFLHRWETRTREKQGRIISTGLQRLFMESWLGWTGKVTIRVANSRVKTFLYFLSKLCTLNLARRLENWLLRVLSSYTVYLGPIRGTFLSVFIPRVYFSLTHTKKVIMAMIKSAARFLR